MPIKRLSRLNRFKLQEERETKGRRVDEIGRILDDYDELREIVVGELRTTAEKLGAPRRTLLGGETRVAPPDRPARVPRRAGPTSRSSLRRAPTWCCSPPAAVPAPRGRSTAGSRACRSTSAPATRSRPPIFTDTESELNAYTSDGQVLRLRVADVPIESRVSRGVEGGGRSRADPSWSGCCRWRPTAGTCCWSPSGARSSGPRRPSSPARTWAARPPSTCLTAIAWSPWSPTATATRSCSHSAHGRTLRFDAGKVRPVKSAAAGGVAGMNLDRGDRVVAAGVATRRRAARRCTSWATARPCRSPSTRSRAAPPGGVVSANPGVPKKEPAGPVAAAVALAGRGRGDGADGVRRPGAVRGRAARALVARRGLAAPRRRGRRRRGGRGDRHPLLALVARATDRQILVARAARAAGAGGRAAVRLVDTAVVGHLGAAELGGLAIGALLLTDAAWLCNFLIYGTTAMCGPAVRRRPARDAVRLRRAGHLARRRASASSWSRCCS